MLTTFFFNVYFLSLYVFSFALPFRLSFSLFEQIFIQSLFIYFPRRNTRTVSPFFSVLTFAHFLSRNAQGFRYDDTVSLLIYRIGFEDASEVESIAEMAVALAEKVKIGVCVMEKKVNCHSEVLSFITLNQSISFLRLLFRLLFCVLMIWYYGGIVSDFEASLNFEECARFPASVFLSSLLDWILQVFSAPMGQIFDRLQAFGEFEVGERVCVCSVLVFLLDVVACC